MPKKCQRTLVVNIYFPFFHLPLLTCQSISQSQHQTSGQIHHILSQNVKDVGNSDTLFFILGQINLIKPHSEAGNNLQLGQSLDQLGISSGIGVSDDSLD
ncbi:hypothetical protein V6N13_104886 [Hibiscus sabdariffa]|uniref:Uncharacterized protein n=1 Tax=Hibiscus sabdariffa TaxID=183260 RepID=A0ABR2SIG3_9ROSI